MRSGSPGPGGTSARSGRRAPRPWQGTQLPAGRAQLRLQVPVEEPERWLRRGRPEHPQVVVFENVGGAFVESAAEDHRTAADADVHPVLQRLPEPVGKAVAGDAAREMVAVSAPTVEGCYRASMDDGWRVCIAFGSRGQLKSSQEALISALGSRLGDQVAVSSGRWGTRIFLYAPGAGSADEAAQVAREVLARHDVSAPVRTEFWSPRDQEWRDAAGEPSADPVAERQALHEARQERERQGAVAARRPPPGGGGRLARPRRG